ncbi:MAG: phosphoenolpyruvate carboxykinase (GTP) [Candidatus Woesearchaeota archaeon]|jgi:phosphoenolpyruvate carboxykinase (GTP)|nr:phosphoenolpyruvate carboxykinase (GTP) [Candidatus Woesearchaeota archaeon]
MNIDKSILNEENLRKLGALNNPHVNKIVEEYINLCKPAKVTVLTDSKEDLQYTRDLALKNGEEKPLATEGHTIHFDGYNDQGRDLENTRVLLPEGLKLAKAIKTKEREEGIKEIFQLLDGIMAGKEMIIKFYCLGPENSKFSISALQITDSAYVVHSEDILYRQGYEEFKRLNGSEKFFHFIHSTGELENNAPKNIDKRRVYMDLEEERVFTINNSYAGNAVGLKKLALRLAISKAQKEDWLCEHMFIMGIHPEGKDRVTYFTGAFPSACGKTSTAMIPGQTIIGDDIAYIRPGEDGVPRAVNVEQGIFGIIENINQKNDPLIYKALTTPRELIVSNILIKDNNPYWLGMGMDLPEEGFNHSGEWKAGNKDSDGKDITPAHKNARYTIRINELDNADKNCDNPQGVPVNGFIYGGRDSDTSVPVSQSLSWAHGVFIGAAIESETTAAAIGQVGVRKHNPMSNVEFLTVPLSTYIQNHLRFGDELDKPPLIFATNYFLKENDQFLNEIVDKKVWMLWMEGRVHNEYEAIETPVGFLPKHEDLKQLFKEVFDRDYTEEEYNQQFSIKTTNLLEKLDRIEEIFKQEDDIPETFYQHLEQQRTRLKEAKEKQGKDIIQPADFS